VLELDQTVYANAILLTRGLGAKLHATDVQEICVMVTATQEMLTEMTQEVAIAIVMQDGAAILVKPNHASLLKLPTLTSQGQVLFLETPVTLFRFLAMLDTPEVVHGRAAAAPFQAQNALQILAVLLKLPILTSPVQVLSAGTLELLFR
jgi:hypothetical protein